MNVIPDCMPKPSILCSVIPANIERANYVIWAAHNLERLGDRVTNICERVIYIVTGERPELDAVQPGPKLL